jgi:hypothetical protein
VVRPGQSASVTGLGDEHGTAVTASYADAAARQRHHRPGRCTARRGPLAGPGTPRRPALRRWLPPEAIKNLLGRSGIPVVRSVEAADADHAVAGLDEVGGPVVIKAIAAGVLHKSRAGGIVLDVRDEADVREAVNTFRARFGDALQGVLLQPMPEPGRELIIAVQSDEVFGPLLVFGLGATDTDLIADRVTRLTPLSDVDVQQLVHGLRCCSPKRIDRTEGEEAPSRACDVCRQPRPRAASAWSASTPAMMTSSSRSSRYPPWSPFPYNPPPQWLCAAPTDGICAATTFRSVVGCSR